LDEQAVTIEFENGATLKILLPESPISCVCAAQKGEDKPQDMVDTGYVLCGCPIYLDVSAESPKDLRWLLPFATERLSRIMCNNGWIADNNGR